MGFNCKNKAALVFPKIGSLEISPMTCRSDGKIRNESSKTMVSVSTSNSVNVVPIESFLKKSSTPNSEVPILVQEKSKSEKNKK